MNKISGKQLHKLLLRSNILNTTGHIAVELAGISVTVEETDSVGNMIQTWLGEWMRLNNVFFRVKQNTQEFPDFFLSDNDVDEILEVKSFIWYNNPGFDVANFDSYWNSIIIHPERLDANYLIFAYTLDNGRLQIRDIYLKKIWEITGKAQKHPITSQWKKGQLYNIRPTSFHNGKKGFNSKAEFIVALYQTNLNRVGKSIADRWIKDFINSYRQTSTVDLSEEITRLLQS